MTSFDTPTATMHLLSLLLPLLPFTTAYEEPNFSMAQFEPTYNNHLVNSTELEYVAHCIAQWCELDRFLNAGTGKIKCSTDLTRPQGGMTMFICNAGDRARCSRAIVQNALVTLWGKTESLSGAMSITMSDPLETDYLIRMKLGWDWACESSKCGREWRDPMRDHCDAASTQWRGVTPQLDRVITEKDFGFNQDAPGIRYMGAKTIVKGVQETWRGLIYPTVRPKVLLLEGETEEEYRADFGYPAEGELAVDFVHWEDKEAEEEDYIRSNLGGN